MQLDSNICLGCQNNSSQIVDTSGSRFQFISKRFLGSSQPNSSNYNSPPTRLNRSTTASNVQDNYIQPNVQTQQNGLKRSLGSTFSKMSEFVNRTPLRNLGSLNRNAPTQTQTAPIQNAPVQQEQPNLSQEKSSTLAENINTIQLRSLGAYQAPSSSQPQPLNHTNQLTQSNVNQSQLRQLTGTADGKIRVLNPLPDAPSTQLNTPEIGSNLTDIATQGLTDGSEQNLNQGTLQATPSSLNRNTSTDNSVRTLDINSDINNAQAETEESTNTSQGAVNNFSNNEVETQVTPLKVPEKPITEEESTDSSSQETITEDVKVKSPKLLAPLAVDSLQSNDDASVEEEQIEDKPASTQEDSNVTSSTETSSSEEPTTESSEESNTETIETTSSETPVLAAPLETNTVVDNSATETVVETETLTTETEEVTEAEEVDSSREIETTESEITEVEITESETNEISETNATETTVPVLEAPIEVSEVVGIQETTPDVDDSEAETVEEAETAVDSLETNTETTTEISTEEVFETIDEVGTEETSETIDEATTEENSEATATSSTSETMSPGLALPNLGDILPTQNIMPITPDADAKPEEIKPIETESEEAKPEEASETTEGEEVKPEEDTQPEESETVELSVPTEEVIEKIKLEDIAIDSEIDYWDAYFAENAKSYDDLVALSEETNSPLLIVDALQGDSGSACSLDTPCSFTTAFSQLKSGGTILIREGNYELRQRINITRSGTEASPIVVRNYPEEKVVLSGKQLSGNSADAGLINISDQKHIRIEGLEFTDYSSKKQFGTVAAIMLRRSSSNIEIIQNEIHDIRTLSPKNSTSALGIAIYGTSPKEPMRNILIQGNHVHDLTLGFSESISLSGNVDGFRIEGNQVHDVDNIGIVVAGSYGTACWESANRNSCDDSFDYARNGLIMGNTVYNVDTRKNSAYPDSTVNAAAGIYVDGARDIVVERNRVYSNGSGLSVSSENAGGLAKDIIVRNNLIYNNVRTGMNLGAENAQKGRVDNLTVTNNTFYNNDLSPQWGGEIFMEYDVDNSLIANNIFYADNYIYDASNDTNLDINLIVNDGLTPEVSGSENNKLIRNIYHGKGVNRTWQWQGKWYNHESFEAFLEASGDKLDELEGSFDADPGFAFLPETPDEQVTEIRLEPSLINPPSKNRAFPLSASIVGELDKAANPRLNDDALDIGAYEH